MFKHLLTLLLTLAASLAFAQEVQMPQSVVVPVGRLAVVEMTFEGDDFTYIVPQALDAFREYTTDPNKVRLRVIGYTPGMYQISAVAAKSVDGKAKLSPFNSCLVNVTGVLPGPAPAPTPTPQPPPPDPGPTPNPQPAGSRTVLFLYESANQSVEQGNLLNLLSKGPVFDYISSKQHQLTLLDDDSSHSDDRLLIEAWKLELREFLNPDGTLKVPVVVVLDKTTRRVLGKKSFAGESVTPDMILNFLKQHGG